MLDRNRAVMDGAILIARETGAQAVLLAAALPEEARYLERALQAERRVIAATPGRNGASVRENDVIALPEVRLRRRGRAKIALMEGLAAGLLFPGEKVVVISGSESLDGGVLDTVAVVELDHAEAELLEGEAGALLPVVRAVTDPAVFDVVLELCLELAREGKEGKRVGLLLTMGDHERVLARSRQLVLNPFAGHAEEECSVLSAAARRAIREFSGMDGAFILRGDGVIVAGGRYLRELAQEQEVPGGLGARHRAGAAITADTHALAFVISESTGDTRIFAGGRIVMTVEKTD